MFVVRDFFFFFFLVYKNNSDFFHFNLICTESYREIKGKNLRTGKNAPWQGGSADPFKPTSLAWIQKYRGMNSWYKCFVQFLDNFSDEKKKAIERFVREWRIFVWLRKNCFCTFFRKRWINFQKWKRYYVHIE